ncbi:hypothetical protein [Streptomyces sp. NPDC006274]|uniref:hypothetical protein n=1 Tax=Streptomyces sp. NPDC006274 TaxID=3154582 RepID=UPI0033B7796F
MLPVLPGREWQIFRTEPAGATLKAGETCLLGIPAAVVHVHAADRFDSPLVTGMLPRPASYLEILRQGEP